MVCLILSLAHHGLASEARSTAAPYVDAHGRLPDHLRQAQNEAETQSGAKSASILNKIETSSARFLNIESKTGNWRRDRKGQPMKIESKHLVRARKLASCGLACSAVPLSFLAGYFIRSAVIVGMGIMIRHWLGYLSLLSC